MIRCSTEKTENWCQKENRNNSENEFKNAWWKWSASWIIIDNKTKHKLGNGFNNNISTDSTLSQAQISNIIQSGGFLGSLLSKIAGPLMKVAVPLAKKCFSSIRNNSSCSNNWCKNSKENTRFWDKNFNNFKQRNEWHDESRSGSWRF